MSDLSREQILKNAMTDTERWLNSIYNHGYRAGKKEIETAMQDSNDTAWLNPADEKDQTTWEWYGLTAYCSKCQKGIDGHAHMYNFCPFCGRKFITKPESEET